MESDTLPMTHFKDVGRIKDIGTIQYLRLRDMMEDRVYPDSEIIPVLVDCADIIRALSKTNEYAQEAITEIDNEMYRISRQHHEAEFRRLTWLEHWEADKLATLINMHLLIVQKVGDFPVEIDTYMPLSGVDAEDFQWWNIGHEGEVVLMVGANRSGKSNLLMLMTKVIAEYGKDLAPWYVKNSNIEIYHGFPVITNQRLYKNTMEEYEGIVYYGETVSKIIYTMGLILAKRHSIPKGFKIYVIIDEMDKIMNSWSQMKSYTADLFQFFNQMGKFKIVFIANWKNYRDISNKWRPSKNEMDVSGGAVACTMFKGARPNDNTKAGFSWIRDRNARRESCYLKWDDFDTMVIGIPDMGKWYFHGAPATLIPDIDISRMLNDIEKVPMPKDDSQDEAFYRNIGNHILANIESWKYQPKDEMEMFAINEMEKDNLLENLGMKVQSKSLQWKGATEIWAKETKEELTVDALKKRYYRYRKRGK
jgi:hypothetical protein